VRGVLDRDRGARHGRRREDDLGPVTVAYVIFTVVVGSVITKVLARRVHRWDPADVAERHG
jgi:hypothetical protein